MAMMLWRSLLSSSSRSIVANHQAAANNILGLGRSLSSGSVLSRLASSASSGSCSNSDPLLFRSLSSLQPGVAAACSIELRAPRLAAISPPLLARREFATSSSSDPNPNYCPPKETQTTDGGVQSWRVVMEEPPWWYNPTRVDIIKSYHKTVAKVVRSEEAEKIKIYVQCCKDPDCRDPDCRRVNIIPNEFTARLPEDVALKIKELPGVSRVFIDPLPLPPPPPQPNIEGLLPIVIYLGLIYCMIVMLIYCIVA